MIPPTSIDGTDITGATIDGTDVQEITVDGDVVFSAGPDIPDASSLIFHLDASQESLSNNATTATLTDFSGQGNDSLSTTTTATYKTNGIGGQPAFEFDASGGFVSTFNLSGDFTVSAAVDLVQGANNEIIQRSGASGFIEVANGSAQSYRAFGNSFNSSVVGSSSAQHPLSLITEFDNGFITINVAGNQVASGSQPQVNVNEVSIPAVNLDGLIAEMAIHQSVGITSNMNTYFNDKYGL